MPRWWTTTFGRSQQQEVVAGCLLDAEDREDYMSADRAQQEINRLEAIVQVRYARNYVCTSSARHR